jgi:hypothetical protein
VLYCAAWTARLYQEGYLHLGTLGYTVQGVMSDSRSFFFAIAPWTLDPGPSSAQDVAGLAGLGLRPKNMGKETGGKTVLFTVANQLNTLSPRLSFGSKFRSSL